jgi:predicted enzyme related to lactoylglutathione lyase
MNRLAGAPCWVDLLTSDAERASSFYTELFGWTAGEGSPEFGGYFIFSKDGVPAAGCMQNQPVLEVPDCWSVYLTTDDAKATVDAAIRNGGTVREGPNDIADLGTEVVITDTVGARIGAWRANKFSGFPESTRQPGMPVYCELLTRGYERAVQFYTDVFGWKGQVASDSPGLRMTRLYDGDRTFAGILDGTSFMHPDQGDYWSVYFKVTNMDQALETAVRLGGTVTDSAMDAAHVRMAGVADPLGTRFKIVG